LLRTIVPTQNCKVYDFEYELSYAITCRLNNYRKRKLLKPEEKTVEHSKNAFEKIVQC